MIGYWLARALRGAAPGRAAGCLVCQVTVDPDDPAFAHPTKFVGPVYQQAEALDLAAERGWVVRRDGAELAWASGRGAELAWASGRGAAWRRVVPSPEPVELVELPLIRVLLDSGALLRRAAGTVVSP
ncbi:MAG TPA: hypothetical protein VFQ68_07325 [Streptosporangiaceae bacterium]|nr:hypothetical protein [Streptosporangiaceae bacterium]